MNHKIPLFAASLLLTGVVAASAAPGVQKPNPPTREELVRYAAARATIVTDYGRIVVRFFPGSAPLHVKNFISLAEAGFYDNTVFHRVIPGFMIQGGDPTGTGTGGPGYAIPAEFSREKKHTPGILSMARTRDPDSAGSQFFIMVGTQPSLDGQYSVFGEVVEGMEVVTAIANTPRDSRDKPLARVAMTSVTIAYGAGTAAAPRPSLSPAPALPPPPPLE